MAGPGAVNAARGRGAAAAELDEVRCPACAAASRTVRCGECSEAVALDADACPACGASQACVRCESCRRWSLRLDWWAVPEPHSALTERWPSYRVARDGTGDFSTIADAVAHVSRDVRLVIAGGTWRESVVIDKRVELVAEGDVVWEAVASTECLVLCDDAFVTGIHFKSDAEGRGCAIVTAQCEPEFRGCSFEADAADAITVREGSLRLQGCEIRRAAGVGIRVASGAALSATQLRVEGCGEVGIATQGVGALERVTVGGAGEVGIAVGRGGAPRLLECTVSASGRCGVSIVGDARPELYGIEIRDGGTALWAAHESRTIARDVRVAGAMTGIVATDAAELTLHVCRVEDCSAEGLSGRDQAALSGARIEVHQRQGLGVAVAGRASLAVAALRVATKGAASAILLKDRAAAVLADLDVMAVGDRGVVVDDTATLMVHGGMLRHPTEPLAYAKTARVHLDGCSVQALGSPAATESMAGSQFVPLASSDSLKTVLSDEPAAPEPVSPPHAPARASLGTELDKALAHLNAHGSINEAELIGLIGPRQARQFARKCEALAGELPFRIRIEMLPGAQKVYVKDGGR